MGIFKKVQSLKFISIGSEKEKSAYYLFRIIEFSSEILKLQRLNTKAIVKVHIGELVEHTDIIYGLSPSQSCFLGIEYARYISKRNVLPIKKNTNPAPPILNRYGLLQIDYVDRSSSVSFRNILTKDSKNMDPRAVALTPDLIDKFDASESFYIGFLAGKRFANGGRKKL